MYGMPGSRFGVMVEVSHQELPDLVKEAQMAGKPSRTFIVGSKEMKLSFDGMFLIDTQSREIVEEESLASRQIFTPLLS